MARRGVLDDFDVRRDIDGTPAEVARGRSLRDGVLADQPVIAFDEDEAKRLLETLRHPDEDAVTPLADLRRRA